MGDAGVGLWFGSCEEDDATDGCDDGDAEQDPADGLECDGLVEDSVIFLVEFLDFGEFVLFGEGAVVEFEEVFLALWFDAIGLVDAEDEHGDTDAGGDDSEADATPAEDGGGGDALAWRGGGSSNGCDGDAFGALWRWASVEAAGDGVGGDELDGACGLADGFDFELEFFALVSWEGEDDGELAGGDASGEGCGAA